MSRGGIETELLLFRLPSLASPRRAGNPQPAECESAECESI
jgi:hypothetical protein